MNWLHNVVAFDCCAVYSKGILLQILAQTANCGREGRKFYSYLKTLKHKSRRNFEFGRFGSTGDPPPRMLRIIFLFKPLLQKVEIREIRSFQWNLLNPPPALGKLKMD